MAVFDKNNIMVPADQARVRTEELAILQGPGDPAWKAFQVENLYASYGAVPGTFEMASAARERESQEQYMSSSSSSDISLELKALKWLVIIFIGFVLFGLFRKQFPVAGAFVGDSVKGLLDFIAWAVPAAVKSVAALVQYAFSE